MTTETNVSITVESPIEIIHKKKHRKTKDLRHVRRFFAIMGFWIIITLLFTLVSNAMVYNENESMTIVKGFFQEPDDSLDMVAIGASELYADYAPTLAWEEHGYTSYNLSVAGIPGNMFHSMAEQVLMHQSPKLLLVNMSGLCWGDDVYGKNPMTRAWMDSVPWSIEKAKEIREAIPRESRLSYFLRIGKYHGNWKNPVALAKTIVLKGCMDFNGFCYTKGLRSFSCCNGISGLGQIYGMSFTDQSKIYLKELIAFCKEKRVENVLFLNLPHQSISSNPEVFTEIKEIVEESGYDYLNLDKGYEAYGIDNASDFSDPDHLNVRGMRKFTHFLGDYITKNYEVISEHDEKTRKQWDRCAAKTSVILDQCEADLDAGVVREYYEAAVYRTPKRMN